MKIVWGDEKKTVVEKKHGISFEQVQKAIENGKLLDIRCHPNTKKYPHQKVIYIDIDGYVCVVPCVPIEDGYFLKTAFRSRIATKQFLSP